MEALKFTPDHLWTEAKSFAMSHNYIVANAGRFIFPESTRFWR